MEKIIIAIILALLPVLSWFLQYFISKYEGNLKLFKEHISTYYLDWIFVPFNFVWIYAISFSFYIWVYSFIMSLMGTIFIHILWRRLHLKEKRPIYMFNIKTKRINLAGIWHFFFHLVQLAFVIIFLISKVSNYFSYVCLFFLLLFFLGTIPASRKVHGKVSMTDLPFLIMGLLIFLAKLIWVIILI